MDKVWRHGLTELDMRVSTFKEKSMAKASLLGQMDQLTMVSSQKTISKAEESTTGLTAENMMDFG